MTTLARLSLATVLPLIGRPVSPTFIVNGQRIRIKTSSVRLRCFKANIRCVACGIEGAYFGVDQYADQSRPHLNLYTASGRLMTRDHIVPKSKGGSDELANAQTMCVVCNGRKDNQ